MSNLDHSCIRSIHFDRDERPTRATVWTKYGMVKIEWIEIAGDRCRFSSGTGDAKRKAVPAHERIVVTELSQKAKINSVRR